MKKAPMMSWNDRFALIEAYKPSDASICATFNLSPNELKTARALHHAGTFQPNKNLDTSKFAGIFVDISDEAVTGMPTPYKAGTVHRPETASRKVKVHEPKKRGRKGDKITTALLAVPNTPVPVAEFTEQYDVSLAVLRQSKRFIEKLSPEDAAAVGKINVKQDKDTKVLMIWREDA